jgi:hypothetical protein
MPGPLIDFVKSQYTLSTVLLPITENNPLFRCPIFWRSSQELGIRPMLAAALAGKAKIKIKIQPLFRILRKLKM